MSGHPCRSANAPSGLSMLSPTLNARRRPPIALRGSAPSRLSCFVSVNQDACYSPESVEGKFCELRHDGVLGSWHQALLESMMRSLREGTKPRRNVRDTHRRRGKGSAPGKEANDATGCSLPFGSAYAFLPRDLALLASDHRLRGALGRCGGGRSSCGRRSVFSSGGVRKPPPYASGRSQGD